MKLKDVIQWIDQKIPFSLAEAWDNVGLMIGDPEQEVRRMAVTLDPLPEAAEEAARLGCQVLLAHHPLFFTPIRKLDLSSDPGRMVRAAVSNNISVLAAHTNWDSIEGGVSWVLAERLGLADVSYLVPSSENGGLGAVGIFKEKILIEKLLQELKQKWNLTHIDCYSQPNCSILKVALCGGSGGDFWQQAKNCGADVYITADVKYHILMDAVRSGLSMIVVDHAEMERLSLEALARRLEISGTLEIILLNNRGLPAPVRI